jgi:hypothetical protein
MVIYLYYNLPYGITVSMLFLYQTLRTYVHMYVCLRACLLNHYKRYELYAFSHQNKLHKINYLQQNTLFYKLLYSLFLINNIMII